MGKDPYQYFRIEARELVDALATGVQALGRTSDPGPDLVPRLLRQAHTLKGAARVVRLLPVADLAHALEEALAPYRQPGATVPGSVTDAVLGHLDAIEAHLRSLDAPAVEGRTERPAAEPAREGADVIRVDRAEIDGLLEALAGQVALTAAVRLRWAAAGGLAARAPLDEVAAREERRDLAGSLVRLERSTLALHGRVARLRLLPAADLFPWLERAARDAARATERSVELHTSGGEVLLDAPVLLALRDGLVHAVRNAVVHGIEPPARRQERGKPPVGRVEVRVERRGARAVFTCRDDGQGLDFAALRDAAARSGALGHREAASLTESEVADLAFEGGLTTRPAPDGLSGRGIGLEVVRAAARRFHGRAALESRPGGGTRLTVEVPWSISSRELLFVESGGETFALPKEAVLRIDSRAAQRIERRGERMVLLEQDRTVPCVELGRLLGRGASATLPARLVRVAAAGLEAALGVERVAEVATAVVLPVPPPAGAAPGVLGAVLDAEGAAVLVLDPAELLGALDSLPAAPEVPAQPPRPPVLVIDDSLTTRMLEEAILTGAGYVVDLAITAEEGLDLAASRRYGLFVVDVELPGMDGFEFVSRVRADAALRGTPAILVTSRSSPEDRRRGLAVGAQAYLVKSEFDQDKLLRTIRSLIG